MSIQSLVQHGLDFGIGCDPVSQGGILKNQCLSVSLLAVNFRLQRVEQH